MPAAENLADLVAGVTKELGALKINDLFSSRTEYPMYEDFLKGASKIRWEGTHAVQRQLAVEGANNAQFVTPFQTVNLDNQDVSKNISVNQRFAFTGWLVDDMAVAMNRGGGGAHKIIDIIETQRFAAMVRLVELYENAIAGKPASSTDDTTPYGINFHIVWASGSGGFDGGHPSGFTDHQGLSSTTYSAHKNWCDTYTAYTDDDLYDKILEASLRTNWRPPVNIAEYGKPGQRAWYGGMTNYLELVKRSRSQNENLSREVVRFHGGLPLLNGSAYKYVPSLDDTTIVNSGSDPFYGVDPFGFEIIGVKGFNMKEYPPMRNAEQPTVVKTNLYHSFNMMCHKRRTQIVIAKSQPAV